jgi:hypothetical protein
MKKVRKHLKKAIVKKRPRKYLKKALKELSEEAEDFFDDFLEGFPKKPVHKLKPVRLYGASIMVRPAYVFAERVENILKFIFGVSITISALLAAFWGFTRTSELLETLIGSIAGRLFMLLIGLSYLIIGIWKLFNLHK